MATNNLAGAVSSIAGNASLDDLKNIADYAKNNPESITQMKDAITSGNPQTALDTLKGIYDGYKNQTAVTPAETTEEVAEKNYLPEDYVPNSNIYGNSNTKDYAEEIGNQYDQMAQTAQDEIAGNVAAGEQNIQKIQNAGEQAYDRLSQVVSKDYQDMINTREAVEANNGNRDGIGHSQFGIAEQSEAHQRAAIAANIEKLKRDTARQLVELQKKGDFKSADALLETTKQKLKTMYADSLRVAQNLYKNYVYEVGLQREDEATQREQEKIDREYMRELGAAFMEKGLMPSAEMLDAIGITNVEAKAYMDAAKVAKRRSGGGGSGGSGGSGGNSGIDDIDDDDIEPAHPVYEKGTLTDVTNNVYGYMAAGQYDNAAWYAYSAKEAGAIDQNYYDNLYDTINSGGATSAGYQNYLRKQG